MKRLKHEVRQTMDMYNTACKEAVSAQQKVNNATFGSKNENSVVSNIVKKKLGNQTHLLSPQDRTPWNDSVSV